MSTVFKQQASKLMGFRSRVVIMLQASKEHFNVHLFTFS